MPESGAKAKRSKKKKKKEGKERKKKKFATPFHSHGE